MQLLIRHSMSVGLLAFILCGCATSDSDDSDYGVTNRPVRLYDISQVEVAPRALSQVLPLYPYDQQRVGQEGEVLIGFFVSLDGSVRAPAIWRATDVRFGECARKAVQKWRYQPAEIDHHPVVCALTVRINFRLLPDYTPRITTTDGLSLEEILKKEANQPPLRMPVSGTPAASASAKATADRGAPVAPPPGIAGR
jgi:TonB family protein